MNEIERIRHALAQAGFTVSEQAWMSASCPDLPTCLRWLHERRKSGWTYGFSLPATERRAA